MTRVIDVVDKVRAKNAGPFWLTIDIFCGSPATYARVRDNLATQSVAKAFQIDPATIKRFELADLNVVKFSLPRPFIQGVAADRDMHGASYSTLVDNIVI